MCVFRVIQNHSSILTGVEVWVELILQIVFRCGTKPMVLETFKPKNFNLKLGISDGAPCFSGSIRLTHFLSCDLIHDVSMRLLKFELSDISVDHRCIASAYPAGQLHHLMIVAKNLSSKLKKICRNKESMAILYAGFEHEALAPCPSAMESAWFPKNSKVKNSTCLYNQPLHNNTVTANTPSQDVTTSVASITKTVGTESVKSPSPPAQAQLDSLNLMLEEVSCPVSQASPSIPTHDLNDPAYYAVAGPSGISSTDPSSMHLVTESIVTPFPFCQDIILESESETMSDDSDVQYLYSISPPSPQE